MGIRSRAPGVSARIPALTVVVYLLQLQLLQCCTGVDGYLTSGVCNEDYQCTRALEKPACCAPCLARCARIVCNEDYQCIRALEKPACCAPWGRSIPIPVCKSLGQRGEPCHLASNRMPYPLRRNRVFWRCPCGENLICASTGQSRIGVCIHSM
ncbi:Hypp1040 [Branchiostoma lanceolatum]|uniref:Hypp1040 protein n=1 Tax=Branchiostoma lanceolatum TaxID=7740 RepID=A0A8K0ELT3_BRALA|nr:Hypp1040 [Branchiostoma lanceolatum]